MNQKVAVITATAGRHHCLERVVRFFLDQTYENSVQLIFQNSSSPQRLNANIPSNRVILINQSLDSDTGKGYVTLGAIYKDAVKHIPEDVEIVNFFDDDDIFLPNHIEEGIKGLNRGGLIAYKPYKSFYRTKDRVVLVNNTLEPSIFVKKEHIQQYGFKDTTSDQHLAWVHPLVDHKQIFEDTKGPATMCYNWGDPFPTFKTSGDPRNPSNFNNYRRHSMDHGDGIVTPMSRNEAEKYYQQFKQ